MRGPVLGMAGALAVCVLLILGSQLASVGHVSHLRAHESGSNLLRARTATAPADVPAAAAAPARDRVAGSTAAAAIHAAARRAFDRPRLAEVPARPVGVRTAAAATDDDRPPLAPPRRATRNGATFPQLPDALADRVDLSVLIQYFNANGSHHELAIGPLVDGYRRCAAAANLSVELLVNVDSRAHDGGDVAAWLAALGPSDYLLLSPDVHELRAYNRLAALSRGRHLLLAQDDEAPNPQPPVWPGYEPCWWLRNASALLNAHDDAAVVGLQELAIHHVRPHPRAPKSCPSYAEAERPRCVDRASGTRTEGVLSAPAGPLLIRREAFVAVRGFDERRVPRGVLGALLVDCDLQARLWARGWATLYLTRLGISTRGEMKFLLEIPIARSAPRAADVATPRALAVRPHARVRMVAPHVAWKQSGACAAVGSAARDFDRAYQQPGSESFARVLGAVRHFNRRALDCSARARASAYPYKRAAAVPPFFPIGPIDCGLPPELQAWGDARAHVALADVPSAALNASDAAAEAWRRLEAPGGACASVATAAARLDFARGDSMRSRRRAVCADGACALPWTALADRVDLSVLIQYFNANGSHHELAIGPLVDGYRRCAAAANLSVELLVNVDSRAHDGGDVAAWLAALGPSDYLLLSPDVHELRAYNRLAALSRGRHLLLAQDDDGVPGACGCEPTNRHCRSTAGDARLPHRPRASWPPQPDAPTAGARVRSAAWLAGAVALLRSPLAAARADASGAGLGAALGGHHVSIKVVSFKAVLFYVPYGDKPSLDTRAHWAELLRAAELAGAAGDAARARLVAAIAAHPPSAGLPLGLFGADSLRADTGGLPLQPRCSVRVVAHATEHDRRVANVSLELAVEAARCADMGPLLIERAAFWAVGGYNESMAARGRAGSVAVDCELQARLALRGMATVAAVPRTADGANAWARAFQTPHVARHVAWRERGMGPAHEARLEQYGWRFERLGSTELARISALALATNRLFHCPAPARPRAARTEAASDVAKGRGPRGAVGRARDVDQSSWTSHAPFDCLVHAVHPACSLLGVGAPAQLSVSHGHSDTVASSF
ncbi:hypothetical protein KFE25_014043 [Diacronema lutheri]|uniref:Uncharacterized protein n=3 Tax=Diacronema lutheri TaxID=2081491 RepID=A0A8J6C6L0_DIALT|nr:hypothetical protein KFE25_014043 [Diacronema lutheri]